MKKLLTLLVLAATFLLPMQVSATCDTGCGHEHSTMAEPPPKVPVSFVEEERNTHMCEYDYAEYQYYVNILRWDNGQASIPWDQFLADTAKIMYEQGGTAPEGYRNLPNWARSFLNEAGIYRSNCISAYHLPLAGTNTTLLSRMRSNLLGSNSFGTAMGYYAGEQTILFIFIR